MSRITTNFRGRRALVLHPDDASRDRLAGILERLGLVVVLREPGDSAAGDPRACDLVLFDADEEIELGPLERLSGPRPSIALIGNEAPSRLTRVVRLNCDSHILKPIRSTGVYSALLLAFNNHERQRHAERELTALRQRLAGRRAVMKAVLKHMDLCGIDEDAAYESLRRRAMEARIPIEIAARMALDEIDDEELPPSPRRHRKA